MLVDTGSDVTGPECKVPVPESKVFASSASISGGCWAVPQAHAAIPAVLDLLPCHVGRRGVIHPVGVEHVLGQLR